MHIPRLSAPVSRALAVACCLLLPLALVAAWGKAIVTHTDRYVATVGPLASDPVVQAAVETRLTELAVDYIDVESRAATLTGLLEERGVDSWLGDRSDELIEALEDVVESAVAQAVDRVVSGEEFRPAWEAANRSAHETAVAVLEGDDSAIPGDGTLSLQLATLLNSVFGILVEEGLLSADQVPELTASFALLDEEQLERARSTYRVVDLVGLWLPVLWVALVAVTVVFARSRRAILGWLGWGTLLSMVVLAVVVWWTRGALVDAIVNTAEREVVEAVWAVLMAGLGWAMTVVAVLSVALLVVRWILRPGSGADRPADSPQLPRA